MKSLKKMWFAAAITALLLSLTACGGSGKSAFSSNNLTYTVGGNITGLNGVLNIQNNGGNPISVDKNGAFTFTRPLAKGTAYNVTILSKPLRQTCAVSNGAGTIKSANVTNVQVTCTDVGGGVTLSGKIAVPSGVVIDGSVNDWNQPYIPNETPESAQVLPNPISVGGYVNQRLAGAIGRSFYSGNPEDYYQVQLKKGDTITLAIGEPNTVKNDLDLYLFNSSGDIVAYSAGTGTYEFLTAPSDGTYFVNVCAESGASNYILMIGTEPSAVMASSGAEILSSQSEIVPNQVVVRYKDTMKTAASTRVFSADMGDIGLTAVAGSPEREMLMAIDNSNIQSETVKTYAYGAARKPFEKNADNNPEQARLRNTIFTIKALRKREDVLSAEPNYIVHSYITNTSDTYYGLQWNLSMIRVPEAWDATRGDDNVIVATIDSGVLMQHPDLRGRLTNTGYNFVRDSKSSMGPNPNDPGDKSPGTSSSSFHGTHVAGIIAAETNNALGTAGITWKTKIMPVRVVGLGGNGTTYDVRQGIRYAAGMSNDSGAVPAKAADIINLSLGGNGYSSIDQTLLNEVRAKGIIVIAAAGNENTSIPSYPAAYNGVIAVSAVNINGSKASYSNYGSYIDVAAPGGDSGDFNGDGYQDLIWSAGGNDSTGSVSYTYTLKAGTSMAAPHVAGIAALMKAVHRNMSPDDLYALLAAGKITDSAGGGKDNYKGYGLINAFKAVIAARELAGGSPIAGLDVNPRTINFGVSGLHSSVTISKIGTGAVSINGVSANTNWLTITPTPGAVDASGFGAYSIDVNRSSLLQDGSYAAVVTFAASSGTSVSVNVTVQVRTTDVVYDAGYHYVLLIRINDNNEFEAVDEIGVKASGGFYSYSFPNVPTGRYRIIAGSDRNCDGYLGDGGEAFGAYPTVDQMIEIDASGNMNDLNFPTNLRLSILNSATMEVITKHSAIP